MAANGAVMRTSVIGALLFKEPEQLYASSINIAETTHADPRCLVSCTIASALVAAVRDSISEFRLNKLTSAVAHER
jgi:ADP-ribosylglycohydrolase